MLIKKTMLILSIFHLIIPIPTQAGLEEALRAHERERARDRATNASQSQPSWRQEYHHEYRQAEQPPVGIRATIRADEETNERILRNRRLYEATHPQPTSSERLGHVVHEHNAAVQVQQKNATTLKIVSDPKVCAVEAQSKAAEILSDFNQNSTQRDLQTKLKEVTKNLQQENAKIDKMDERAGYVYNRIGELNLPPEAREHVLRIFEVGTNQQINEILTSYNVQPLTDSQITCLRTDFYAHKTAILQLETFKEAKIQLERIIATKEYVVSADIASFKSTFAQQDPETQARSYLELSADLGHKKANEEYLKIDKERAQIQMQHGEWGKQKVIQTCDDTTKHYEDPIALLQAKQQTAREAIIANYDTELRNKSVDELTEMLSASKNKQAKLEKDLDSAWREANNCKGTLHQKYPNVKNNRQVAKIEQGLQETARDFAKVQENLAMEKEKEKKIGENLEKNRTKEQLAAETNEKTKVESAQRRHHSKSQEAGSSSAREYQDIEQRIDKGKRKADASTAENPTINATETKEKFESALGQFCYEHFTEEGARHKQQKEFKKAENDWTDAKVRLSEIEGALELEKEKERLISEEIARCEKFISAQWREREQQLTAQLQECTQKIENYKKMEGRANEQKNLPWAREEREKEEARIQTIKAQLPSIYGMLQQKTFTSEYKQQLENIKNELSLKKDKSTEENARLEAIIKTLQEQGQIYIRTQEISPQAIDILKKYNVAIEKFQRFVGNKLECELFSESGQKVETARSVESQQSNNPNVKNCIQTAIRFGEKAVDMAYVGDIQNASQMNDLSQAFTNLGHCIRITDSFVSPMEQATNYSEEICTQQKTNNLIKLSEATLDMVSTYQHTPSTVDNPYAGLHALEKIGRCLQCFAQGAGHATLEFSSTVNQVINDPQKTATDLYNSLSTAVNSYFNQKIAIYDQCTGDFSKVHEQLKDSPDSIKKYYEAVADQYRYELADLQPCEKDIEAWLVYAIISDRQKAARWEAIKRMPAEKIAYHAGKFAAETILTEGVFRLANGALKIANVEMQLLHQEVKVGASVLAATAKETVEQTAKQFSLTADQWGTRMIQAQVPKAEKIVEVAAADTENIFKITIKNPCLTEACEKIAANPLKMEILKDAGKAGTQAVKKANEEATLAGTTLKLPENVVKAMEELAARPVEAEIIKEAGTAGVKAATREAISLAGYDTSLGNLKKLEEAANMFKNNASAISKDGPLTKLLECGKAESSVGNLATARGAAYELEKAHDLAKAGEKIVSFGNKTPLVHPKTGLVIKVLDVDIETATKIIECKSIDWTKATSKGIDTIKSKLPELRELALSKGKSFEFHSKLEIPNDLKNWLNDQKITFIVG